MGTRAIKKINHLGIWQFTLLGVIAWFVTPLIVKYFWGDPIWRPNLLGFPLSKWLIVARAFVLALILIAAILTILSINYTDKTKGRSWWSDKWEFGKMYGELLKYFQDADPNRIYEKDLPKIDWKDADGIILGKAGKRLVNRDSAGEGNVAVIAIPGAGKTTAVVVPTAERFNADIGGGGIFAVDIKGDIYNATKNKRKIKAFNAMDPKNSYHFDPFDGIKEMSTMERRIFLKNMAFNIVEDDPGDNGKYFADGAKDFFRGIAVYLIEKNPDITFPEVVDKILLGNPIDWVLEIKDSGITAAQITLNRKYGENEKNLAGCYSHLAACLEPFVDFAEVLDGKGDCITPSDLENGYDVYIEVPQDFIDVLAPLTSMITQNFLTAFTKRPDKSSGNAGNPILMLLDEFAIMRFDYKAISNALASLRSKNVSVLMAFQSLAQLEKNYGKLGARALMDCIAILVFMSATDVESRNYMSDLLGTKKIYRASVSSSSERTSTTIQESREPVIQPADLGNLGDNVMIYKKGQYIKAEKAVTFKK